MKYFILALFLAMSVNVMAELNAILFLTDDIKIEVHEISPRRATQAIYYRQAIDSIPAIYPNSEIITNIQHGKLNLQKKFYYSLVSYIETSDSKLVVSGGSMWVENKAWSYRVVIPKSLYPHLQNKLIEKVADLAL